MPDALRLVVVEDDLLIMEYLKQVCIDLGADVVGSADNAPDALATIRAQKPDYVLMDVRLDGTRDGVDVALAVHGELPDIRIVFITGSNEPPTIARIQDDHPHRILLKPIDPEDLRQILC